MATRQPLPAYREMRRLQHEMEHLLSDLTPALQWLRAGEYPPVNVTRAGDAITIESLCPGVDRDTLDITVVGDAVTIHGERKPEPDVPPERYHRRERPLGVFTRTVSMGERLDPDRTSATYTSGILRVQLARAPEAAPRKIQIQSGSAPAPAGDRS
jgi:HSP20 family protein